MHMLQNKNSGSIADVIRCDEPTYLIWKWRPNNYSNNNQRENSIRWGSSLRVKDGEVAIFVFKQNNETIQEFIEGPCDKILKTINFPIVSSLINIAYNGNSPFPAEVYFINLSKIIQIPFAVPFFNIFDPRFQDFSAPIAIRGTLTFNISNYRDFIKLHRLNEFNLDEFQLQIRNSLTRFLKSTVSNIPSDLNVPVVQIEKYINEINELAESKIRKHFLEVFGVHILSLDISDLELDETSENYLELKNVTQNLNTATLEAQTHINIQNMHDLQKINMTHLDDTLRIQREESQYAKHKETQNANLEVFNIEQQASIGLAGAESLGKMNSNIDFGGHTGFNPGAMFAGMALGNVVGQNVAGIVNKAMTESNSKSKTVPSSNVNTTPPPLPKVEYYIEKDGKSIGPLSLQVVFQMISTGLIAKQTLIWRPGLTEWTTVNSLSETQSQFQLENTDNHTFPNISE